MATATTPPKTQCPGCGAKIPSTVSICPYCVTPIQPSGGAAAAKDRSPVLERLAKMREKPEFEDGMAWTPMEGPAFQRARARGRRGTALLAVGAIVVGSGVSSGASSPLPLRIRVIAGALMMVLGLVFVLRSKAARKEILSRPLLKRPARVADRRSETTIRGSRGDTTYFFELEFEDGSKAEFGYPGRGASDNPLTNGVTGIAYTRGQELVAFKRVRV
jgi:hypothetical protein